MPRINTLRRVLIATVGIFVLAIAALAILLGGALESLGDSPAQRAVALGSAVAAALLLTVLVGGWTLERILIRPLERMGADARRIASGELGHRLDPSGVRELARLASAVNEMALHLVRDRTKLADNIRSLEETNLELVEARDQVVHAARLASVGTLAAGVAHEVGNPLTAIIGYADLARSRAERDGADPTMLDAIREEADRIDRIVRGLLDYARPPERVAGPGEALERVRSLLERQGRLSRVSLELQVAPDIATAQVDLHRMEQVLVNLLLNALDALEGHPGGWIRVSVAGEPGRAALEPIRRQGDPPELDYRHRRRVAGENDGRPPDALRTARRVVVVSVEDNGVGLAPEDVDRVFDPFFTTKEPGKGTGLGLAICARLVESMGGELTAERRPEGGACFRMRIPEMGGGDVERSGRRQGSDGGTGVEPGIAGTVEREP